jgi:hypothetical protein
LKELNYYYLIGLQMGIYPAAAVLQHTTTHITQNNTTRKQNTTHRATQTMKGHYTQRIQLKRTKLSL